MRKASGLVVPLEGAIPAFAQNPWPGSKCSQCSASKSVLYVLLSHAVAVFEEVSDQCC